MVLLLLLLGLFSSGSVGGNNIHSKFNDALASVLNHHWGNLTCSSQLYNAFEIATTPLEVAFHCKINNNNEPYWVVNNQAAYSTHQRDHLAAQGFSFEERYEGSIAVLTVKVNATADKNETELYCISLPWLGITSHNATLLIIAGKHSWSNNYSR